MIMILLSCQQIWSKWNKRSSAMREKRDSGGSCLSCKNPVIIIIYRWLMSWIKASPTFTVCSDLAFFYQHWLCTHSRAFTAEQASIFPLRNWEGHLHLQACISGWVHLKPRGHIHCFNTQSLPMASGILSEGSKRYVSPSAWLTLDWNLLDPRSVGGRWKALGCRISPQRTGFIYQAVRRRPFSNRCFLNLWRGLICGHSRCECRSRLCL